MRGVQAAVLLGLLGVAAGSKLKKCLCYDPVKDANCDGTFSDQCQDYIKEVALGCWPSVVGMVLFILIVPLAAVLLCCCAGKGDKKPESPSRMRLWLLIGLVAACVVAASVTSYFTISESDGLADGINALSDVVDREVVAKMNNDAHDVQVAFDGLPDSIASASVKADVRAFAARFSQQAKDIDDAEQDVLKWDHGSGQWDSRKGLTIAFSVAAIVVIILSLAMTWLGRPGFSYCVLFFVCLVGTMVSVAALAYQSTDQVSSDVCDDYTGVQEVVLLRAHNELGCVNGSTQGVASLLSSFSKADTEAAKPLLQLAFCTSFDCTQPKQTFLALEAGMRNGTQLPLKDPSAPEAAGCEAPCSVAACAGACTGQLKTDSAAAVAEAAKYNASMQTLGSVAARWDQCAWLTEASAEFEDPLCHKVEPKADSLWKAMLVMLACVLVTAAALLVATTDARNGRSNRRKDYNEVDSEDALDIYEVPATQLKTYGTNAK